MMLSKRALALLNTPQYGKILDDQPAQAYQWHFTNDKKLTLSFESSYHQMRIPLMDAISALLNSGDLKNLFILNFREVENFLRDQNDRPAFEGAEIAEIEKIFDLIYVDLTKEFFKYHHTCLPKTATFTEKNHFWLQSFASLQSVEFVLFEQEWLYFYDKRSDSIVSFNISE